MHDGEPIIELNGLHTIRGGLPDPSRIMIHEEFQPVRLAKGRVAQGKARIACPLQNLMRKSPDPAFPVRS